MASKIGAGGKPQEYDESTGRYGDSLDYTGKGKEYRQNTPYEEIIRGTVPETAYGFADKNNQDDDELNSYQLPKEPIVRKRQDAEKWAKYDYDYERYKKEEPNITKDVDDISKAVGLSLIGREHWLKSKKSYDRKVNDKRLSVDYKPLGDVIRYTFEHKIQKAPEDIRKTLAKFEEKGYNIIAVDNKWKESGAYKGINVDIVSPKGIPIEVQFTTYNNSDLKNRMHRYYEIVRDSRTPATIKALAEKKMYELATLWEVPDRITEV